MEYFHSDHIIYSVPQGLLERLEDRLPVEEAEAPAQDIFAPNYDSADSSNSAPSLTVEAARPGADMVYNRGSWAQQEKSSPLRNKLRELLNAPRSMRRSSDCFGSRIDRIGAQSGMGCGRRVSDLKGDGQLGHVGWFCRVKRVTLIPPALTPLCVFCFYSCSE